MTADASLLRQAAAPVLLAALVLLGGCGPQGRKIDRDGHFVNRDRMGKGLVIILPGIEGEDDNNRDLRRGLAAGGVPYALAIYHWGFPVPGLNLLVNQTDIAGNRRAAGELAKFIVRYQKRHPDKPIFLMGHSAGGGIAIFTLEALADMPDAQPVTGTILLSSSISANYRLDKAMKMIQRGIVNGYNPDDTAWLGTGTAVFGNVDGDHGESAGRTGFHCQEAKLFQFKVSAADLGLQGDQHFIITNGDLIAKHAPRWVLTDNWPPPRRNVDQQRGSP